MTPMAHHDYLTRYRWAGSVEYLRKTYEQETFDRRYRSGARAKRSGGLGSA